MLACAQHSKLAQVRLIANPVTMGDSPLNLNTTDLPRASGSEAEATASPSRLARGKETAKDLRLKLLGSRLPLGPWDFWHDRQGRTRKEAHTDPNVAAEEKPSFANKPAYGDSLEVLQSNINSVKRFWQVYNGFENFSDKLPSKDSVHLFLSGIKPVWEDPQNAKGGSWTFRVAKAKASELYKEMCVLAIGGTLQAAVKADRESMPMEQCYYLVPVGY